MNDLYWDYKRLHLCVWCGKQDARTLIGKIYCFECNEKHIKHEKERLKDPEVRAKVNALQRKRTQSRKEQGLCINCGKRKALTGKSYCERCAIKIRERSLKKRRENGQKDRNEEVYKGNCYICFAPAAPGYKLCEKCLEQARAASRIASEKAKRNREEKRRKRGTKNEISTC